MPARSSGPPGAVPGWLAWCLCLPEDEIERVALMRIIWVIAPFIGNGQHLLPRQATQLPISRPRIDVEVDAATCLIGHAGLTELVDCLDDLCHDVCGPCIVFRRTDIQRLHF